jgi:hypothetical protein
MAFGELPDAPTFIGAAVVVGAGILSSDGGRRLIAKIWR